MYTPLFQYQPHTEPVFTGGEVVTESRWHQPWSDPVRVARDPRAAIALAASGLFFTPQTAGEVITVDKWFAWLSDPVRVKPGLLASLQAAEIIGSVAPVVPFSWFDPGNFTLPVRFKQGLPSQEQQVLSFQPTPVVPFSWFNELSKPRKLDKDGLRAEEQQFITLNPLPRVSFGWFDNLSDPVRVKPGLDKALQQFFTSDTVPIPVTKTMTWFANLSDPVRVKPGLKASLQQFLAAPSQVRPTPATSGVLDATETKDTFLGATSFWDRIVSGEIGVIELNFTGAEIGVSPTNPSAGTSGVVVTVIAGAGGSVAQTVSSASVSIRII